MAWSLYTIVETEIPALNPLTLENGIGKIDPGKKAGSATQPVRAEAVADRRGPTASVWSL